MFNCLAEETKNTPPQYAAYREFLAKLLKKYKDNNGRYLKTRT